MINKIIIILVILSFTNFLGIVQEENLIFILPLKDILLTFIIIYTLPYIFNQKYLNNVFNNKKYINISIIGMLILVTIVMLSMPFRGTNDLVGIFKMARVFYTLIIGYYIAILIKKSLITENFIHKLILFLGVYYSILSIAYSLFPNFVEIIFLGLKAETYSNVWDTFYQRSVLKANDGLLFIHLAFILLLSKYLFTKDRSSLKYIFILFTGMFFQGWRAPLITTLLSSILLLRFVNLDLNKISKFSLMIILLIIFSFWIEDNFYKGALSSKLLSSYSEIFGGQEGSFDGRIERSLFYQLPMFFKSFWIGYGFVPNDSHLASLLGHRGDGLYSLYYFDFGYGSLFNMFGFIGSLVFLYFCLKMLIGAYKSILYNNKEIYTATLLVFLIMLLISNFTFAALITELGILPLSIIIALSITQENKINLIEK